MPQNAHVCSSCPGWSIGTHGRRFESQGCHFFGMWFATDTRSLFPQNAPPPYFVPAAIEKADLLSPGRLVPPKIQNGELNDHAPMPRAPFKQTKGTALEGPADASCRDFCSPPEHHELATCLLELSWPRVVFFFNTFPTFFVCSESVRTFVCRRYPCFPK